MASLQNESPGVTHTYVARAWYRDTATLFNIASGAAILLQETEFTHAIPEKYHPALVAIVAMLNVLIRFQSSTRPVALQQGTQVEVKTIDPKTPNPGTVNLTNLGKPLLVLALVGGLALTPSCAKPAPTLSPVGVTAVRATQVIKAIDVLRDAAIDLNGQTPPVISTAHTRTVVNFHEAAVKTIGATPGGWKPTVSAALEQLQHDLLPDEWSRLLPYVSLVRTLIEAAS